MKKYRISIDHPVEPAITLNTYQNHAVSSSDLNSTNHVNSTDNLQPPDSGSPYQTCSCKSSVLQLLGDDDLDKAYQQNLVHRRPAAIGRRASSAWSVRHHAHRICNVKTLRKRVPIVTWLPQYSTSAAIADLVAGVTVGLMMIPQAIAYSNIAGLPAQIGLYSALTACFVYVVFGSTKDCSMGPTAIAALLTRENNHGFGVEGAVLLCFVTGCVQLIMGALQLGFLIDFISGPVSIGFTSAIAIVIATTQVKDILGLKFSAEGFVYVWENIFQEISNTSFHDATLGILCIVVIIVLRKVKDIRIGPENDKERKPYQDHLTKVVWFISTARNIIVVLVSAIIAFLFHYYGAEQPFVLTGTVKAGLPKMGPPPFTVHVGNSTYSFTEVVGSLGTSIIVVPLLGIMENIAVAKVFADGRSIDASQEMIALGCCNIIGSLVQSMPAAGALSRGAVNNASGARTTGSSIYTGIIVILALVLFTPYFYYIPKAALAAVIIAAVAFMFELQVLKPIWKTKKTDLIPAVVTFLCCLFWKLEIGIAIGIGINLISLLYASARPSVHVEHISTTSNNIDYLLITPDRSLSFPSVEYVRSLVSKAGIQLGSSHSPVVIDAKHIQGADFTVAKGIKSLTEDFQNRNQPIIFFNLKPSVVAVLQGVQPKNLVSCGSFSELEAHLNNIISSENLNSANSSNHM